MTTLDYIIDGLIILDGIIALALILVIAASVWGHPR